MINLLILVLITLLVMVGFLLLYNYNKKDITPLRVGDTAPNFALKDSAGITRTLSEFHGRPIILYFYPKADTPGCTTQACSLRDSYDDFVKNNITVIGISYDTPENQKIFKEKYNLPFILLSDSQKTVAKKYGAYQGPLNDLFPNRITFIIDPSGRIKKILHKVDVQSHTAQVLKAAQE